VGLRCAAEGAPRRSPCARSCRAPWLERGAAIERVERSALCVEVQLIAHDVFVHAMRQVFTKTVRQGQEQVVHTLFVEDSSQNPAGLPTVVLAKELTDLLHRDIALEIQVEILE
jgi:hypothetical protein